MANNQPYDLQDLQDRIHTLVDNDPDTPATDDDEWSTRLNFIYQAIGNWEGQDVFWDELWKTYTHADVVAASDSTYTISNTDFKTPPGGFLRLILNGVTSYVPFISPEQYQTYGGEARVAYITGSNLAGWTLNLGWTPVDGDGTVGATMRFDYYKMAAIPTLTTDKVEMSDPNYIVYWVAGQKSLADSQNNKYSVYDTMAQRCMDNMRVMNELNGSYQSNAIEDLDFINHGAVLGE